MFPLLLAWEAVELITISRFPVICDIITMILTWGHYTAWFSQVKQDIACYAKYRWPLRSCRFHEARFRSGPVHFKGEIVLAINWTALYIINPRTSQFHKLPYSQMSEVQCIRDRLTMWEEYCFRWLFQYTLQWRQLPCTNFYITMDTSTFQTPE